MGCWSRSIVAPIAERHSLSSGRSGAAQWIAGRLVEATGFEPATFRPQPNALPVISGVAGFRTRMPACAERPRAAELPADLVLEWDLEAIPRGGDREVYLHRWLCHALARRHRRRCRARVRPGARGSPDGGRVAPPGAAGTRRARSCRRADVGSRRARNRRRPPRGGPLRGRAARRLRGDRGRRGGSSAPARACRPAASCAAPLRGRRAAPPVPQRAVRRPPPPLRCRVRHRDRRPRGAS